MDLIYVSGKLNCINLCTFLKSLYNVLWYNLAMINIKVVDDATANLITVESVTVVWIPFASRINKYNHSTNILYNVLIIAMVYKTHFDVMLYCSMDLI